MKMRMLLLVVLALLPAVAMATNYTVGDEKGWNPKVDYEAWVKKHKPFYKGDWLVFEYQNGRSDVVQVDEVGYDNCDKANAISSYSKGHTYAFQLKEAKDYYFICSYGYCYDGMKVAVTAKKGPASGSSSSSSSGDGSSSKSDTASSKSGAESSLVKNSPFAAIVAVAFFFLRML
uniref:Phytocyanin domain-containing protein n=1 Tax=Leersia perrieri TaxID=77586 RepID=A0A0D9WUS0_9ORYZ